MAKKSGQKQYSLTFLPFDISVKAPRGAKIWEAAKKAHLPLRAACGGEGTCGECLVQIKSGTYEAKPSAVLSGHFVSQGYSLACQTDITDDLVVVLPQFQELLIKSVVGSEFFEEHKNNISGIFEHDPVVKSLELQLPSPTLEDNYSDLKRMEREFQKKTGMDKPSCTYSVLAKLAQAVRAEHGQVRVVYIHFPNQATIVDVFPVREDKKICGVACDIGTSTVALHVVDLKTGKIESTASSLNQQIKCGEDIISRINYAQKHGHLQELQELIVRTINHLIESASQKTRMSPSDVYYASFSGNTTMIHLLLKLEPRYIREEPYVPTFNDLPLIDGRELGLNMNPEAKIHLSPAVGSYVGGDITAGLLCTPILMDSEKTALFIDAGTNGELVVGNKEWLMTCACSAGPAFEGSGITCGMPASEGAIEKVELDKSGDVHYKVIGRINPRGLCGSGLVDLLAELFIHGYLDRHGKFKEPKASQRMVDSEEGLAFVVVEGKKSFWGKDLILTERDIANLIRTKGAIYSACSLLLKNVGLPYDKIDALYIAGGFGQHLNIENAIRIGLLPDLERDRFYYIGNSSLLGAYLILLSDKNKDLANVIAQRMTYVELNTEPSYMNEFTGSLFLPHTDINQFPSVKRIFENKS
ncbi:MAG: ASKHA domain-containing protein [Candidatus Aminicenantes bacterium]|nr:ASKHA domain-containing protein [Candidatus Aminicenantes bacterium]MDH5742157.1 ASKHA domain-containing protein [Candidatus Aminicenantes bacterium]